MRYFLLIGLLLTVLLTACGHNSQNKGGMIISAGTFNYTGDYYNDNYVWGGAMNLAWTELKDSFVGEPIAIASENQDALYITKRLNDPVFSKADLDEASYYIKSGYGQATVDAINKECRAKFPSKTIPDLLLKLGGRDIISYAYFLKEIEYKVAFAQQPVKFADKEVQGFAANRDSYQNVHIVHYESDDKFILALSLKDNSDQIFLAKGYPMSHPDEVVSFLQVVAPASADKNELPGKVMNKKDIFEAPMLHLDHQRVYQEMIGQKLKNPKLKGYIISVMQEVIKFDMDEKGARVENEAVIGMVTSAAPEAYTPKKLILDKPYWVIMKRANSNNPYFLLGVKDTTVMKPVR